ncbi:MAG: hypothetical protein Q7S34_02875 [bacterium]|nr:hypothetical protein [bacterium]
MSFNYTNQKGFANIVLTIVIVVIAGAVGYFVLVKKLGPIAQQPTPTPTQTNAPAPTFASSWKTYTNIEYGFQLIFTDAWRGYKVKLQEISSNFGAGTLAFRVPTKSKIYVDEFGQDGYATVLKISILNPEYWASLQNEEGPKPTFLARNSNYVFTYSLWQDPPEDLLNVDFEWSKVTSSFKFAK